MAKIDDWFLILLDNPFRHKAWWNSRYKRNLIFCAISTGFALVSLYLARHHRHGFVKIAAMATVVANGRNILFLLVRLFRVARRRQRQLVIHAATLRDKERKLKTEIQRLDAEMRNKERRLKAEIRQIDAEMRTAKVGLVVAVAGVLLDCFSAKTAPPPPAPTASQSGYPQRDFIEEVPFEEIKK